MTRSRSLFARSSPVLMGIALSVPSALGVPPQLAPNPGTQTSPSDRQSECHDPGLLHRNAQTESGARSCRLKFGLSELDVGTLENKPFTAKESFSEWRALPTDKAEKKKLKNKLTGWKMSRDGTRLISTPFPFTVARDTRGRVLQSVWAGEDYANGIAYHQGTLCDPLTERIISFGGPDSNWIPTLTGGSETGDTPVKSENTWLPLATVSYRLTRWSMRDKVVDLGYREMDGLRVHGHRWSSGRPDGAAAGDFKELWSSEELKADVLYIEQSQTRGAGIRAELTAVRLQNPDPDLFRISAGDPAKTILIERGLSADPCAAALAPGR
jgi:hypothetical protein